MKKILMLSLTVVLSVGLLTGCGIVGRRPAPHAGESWAIAYLNVINELVKQYGDWHFEQDLFGEDGIEIGVGIVRLIDFDGNGVPELFVAISEDGDFWIRKQMVFGYYNGLVVLLYESSVSNPGTDVSPEIKFIYRDGRTYLRNIQAIADGRYYTLVEGEWVAVMTYFLDIWRGMDSEDDEAEHLLNDEVATADELFEAIETMETGELTTIVLVPCCFDPIELDETELVVSKLRVIAGY